MEQDLRTRVNRDATKMTTELASIRSGHYYSEEQVLERLYQVRELVCNLILIVEYPQLSLLAERLEDGRNRP